MQLADGRAATYRRRQIQTRLTSTSVSTATIEADHQISFEPGRKLSAMTNARVQSLEKVSMKA